MRRVFVGSILRRRRRVERGEPGVQRAWAEQLGFGEQTGADRRPLPRQVEVVDHGAVVEARAADEDRPRAAPGDVGDGAAVLALELGDREVARRVDEIEQMVRYPRSVLPARAWRCRCPSRGTPASSRSTAVRCRPVARRQPAPRSTCRTRSAPRPRRGGARRSQRRRRGCAPVCDGLGEQLDEATLEVVRRGAR